MSANYHTHCSFCDGRGRPEEYIERAVGKGFSSLGFSSHGPTPFVTDWTMSEAAAAEYCRTIDSLREKYRDKIHIYKGMELDYFSGDIRNIFHKYDLDYTIGSVHFIKSWTDGEYLGVDDSCENFERALIDHANFDIKKFAETYYETVLEMLQNERFDILGHLDLVKKNNSGNKFFNENEKWYIELVKNVVKKVSDYNAMVEVNTGGISRGYTDEPYPSAWIIRECKKYDIPLVLSSDAHVPENIDFYFEEAKRIIRSAGYSELWELENGRWVNRRI